MTKKVLHLDSNNILLAETLEKAGLTNDFDYQSTKEEVLSKINDYDGIVIRSRFKLDKDFLEKAKNLKFIARVGAGLESIDCEFASQQGIALIAAPEGNANAVGEHALGMILSLFNNLNRADAEIREGKWNRESNRGHELDGKTVGIIGYGNMGKSFAKKLRGFDTKVIFYDILPNLEDENAKQVSLETLFEETDVLSLHTPWTPETDKMVNTIFIENFKKKLWIINTSRGKNLVTDDLLRAIEKEKVLGAALDVLEYEKLSFESLFSSNDVPEGFKKLLQEKRVLLTPHIAGWTFESHEKLALVIANKIIHLYQNAV